MYVHVPFCATRCGYCDFNTYTPGELGSSSSPSSWLEAVRRELDLAVRVLGEPVPADTVFVGGGTPSLLGADGLAAVLDAIRESLGVAPGAEVTIEANPESTAPEFFAGSTNWARRNPADVPRCQLSVLGVCVPERFRPPTWPLWMM